MDVGSPPTAVVDPDRLQALAATGLLESGPEESFQRLGALARRLTGASAALISLVDRDRQHFKCCLGLPQPWAAEGGTPLSHSICQHALAGAEPLVIPDTAADPRLVGNRAVDELGAAAYLGIPLVGSGGHVLGSFCVINDRPRHWSADDVAIMADLAVSVMAEIELRELVRQREDMVAAEAASRLRAEGLLALSGVLGAAIDVDQVVGGVVSSAPLVAGAAFANVALELDEDDTLELRHGPHLDPSIGAQWPRVPRDHSTPLGAAVVTGSAQYLPDAPSIKASFPVGYDDAVAAGFRALAAVPIPGMAAAVGFAWTEPVDFTPTMTDTLGLVADLAGQALHRAGVYERERRIAQRLQHSLLPVELPAIPGVRLAWRHEAGSDGLDVGGDWYDVGRLDPDRWVLAVGDVVGRGLTAASVMGQLRNAFSALASNAVDLTRLVDRLDLVAADLDWRGFSTMVAVEYRVADRSLTVVSAGHPPPMVRRRDGRIERFEARGRPIGVAEGDDRIPLTGRLDPGDALVLYTDGLVERRSESIDEGLDRLAAELGRLPPGEPDALCSRLLTEVGLDRSDDVALLVLTVDDPIAP